MTGKGRDLAASVRQRLLNHSRESREEFQSVLTRYGLERFMFRIGRSPHAGEFVLKGAMLFALWTGRARRATWDMDLLGRGTNDVERLEEVFREICVLAVPPDGVVFDPESVRGGRIREDLEYEGVRILLEARLGKARVRIQVDVGFGDAVTPRPRTIVFPTLLDSPAPELAAYPRETVVAEKLHAMVVLGIANSRMKDFHDVWSLARGFAFDGGLLSRAIAATFRRRRTPLPVGEITALSASFAGDGAKRAQWSAFVRRGRLPAAAPALPEVIDELGIFLLPPLRALAAGSPFEGAWMAGGPWTSPSS